MKYHKLTLNAGALFMAAALAACSGGKTEEQAAPNAAEVAVAKTVTPDDREKCYGIAKAGENDGVANQDNGAGTAVLDYQGNAWKFTAAGECAKQGGTLTEASDNDPPVVPAVG